MAIELVVRERLEVDQRQCEIVRPFLRQVVADQDATTSLDDRRPSNGVLLERVDLARVECVLDAAGDHVILHWSSPLSTSHENGSPVAEQCRSWVAVHT